MTKKSEKKTDQILGWWVSKNHINDCAKCGDKMVECPREGHPNSKFWELEQDDGMVLVVCPNNCLEDEVNK